MSPTDKDPLTLEAAHIHSLLNLGWCQEAMAQTDANDNGWFVVHMPTVEGTVQELLLRQGHSAHHDAMGWRDRSGTGVQTWMLGADAQGHVHVFVQVDQTSGQITPEQTELWAHCVQQFHRLCTRLRELDHTLRSARARAQAVCAGQAPADITLPHAVWGAWMQALGAMQQTAVQRGWGLEPLGLLPPADPQELDAVEARHGMRMPEQLRALLAGFSAELRFGWRCARNDKPAGKLKSLYSGGIRGTVWSLEMIDRHAISNFEGWREHFFGAEGCGEDEHEAPNPARLWEGQFPFAHLINGDMLTIDTTHSDPLRQPVRYFSHEVEGLHGKVLAPHLYAFLDQWTALGCAGDEQHSWHGLVTAQGLRADTRLGQQWAAWLAKDPHLRAPDEAPRAVLARNAADRQLLECAKADDLAGVQAALDRGAQVNCSPDDWRDENHTAVIHAVQNKSIAMLELLQARGASLSTTLLPMQVAAWRSDVKTVRWLIDHGARLDPWRDDRFSPLHRLIDSDYSEEDYRLILDMMLTAGANPNVCHDQESFSARTTALMRTGPWSVARLLAAGADPTLRDVAGCTALHQVDHPDSVALLLAQGLDVNDPSHPGPAGPGRTPIQCVLQQSDDPIDTVNALLAAGADPWLADSNGDTAWWYCIHASCVERLVDLGFDPSARDAKGRTLLHRLLLWTSGRLYDHFLGCTLALLGRGLPIEAADGEGNTPLHVAASHYSSEHDQPTLRFLLEQGASRTATNHEGKTAWEMIAKKHRKSVAWLRA